jgi:hypothetical protein
LGTDHVRFQQLHRGLPVAGAELTVHLRGRLVTAVARGEVSAGDGGARPPGCSRGRRSRGSRGSSADCAEARDPEPGPP